MGYTGISEAEERGLSVSCGPSGCASSLNIPPLALQPIASEVGRLQKWKIARK